MKHVFLIDGSGLIFRSYFVQRDPMTRPDGTPVNAVYGFTSMVMRLLNEIEFDHVAMVFDSAGKTFRSDIYSDYKAHRPAPPEDLIPQFALVRDASKALGIKSVELEGFEADDLIATYAKQALQVGADVRILSSDKDLMQLVRPGVTLIRPEKSGFAEIGPEQVREKFGVEPERVVDVQALSGDSVDNIPGVEGIGPKTAAQLIQEFGSLEEVLSNAETIKQPKRRERLMTQADNARVSLKLVTLKDHVDTPVPLEDFDFTETNADDFLNFCIENGFKSLVQRATNRGVLSEGAMDAYVKGVNALGEHFGSTQQGTDQVELEVPQVTEIEYTLVQTENDLKTWIAAAQDAGFVAVDTETTSLDAMAAELVGVSLCVEPGKACYIPLSHKGAEAQGDLLGGGDTGAPEQIPMDRALELLKPMLEDPGVLKVGQNLKYDMVILGNCGIDLVPVDDTMVMSYVLEGGLHGHGMDELARLHLGIETIKFKDVAGTGKSQVTFDHVELDKARDYAAEDADVTCRLYKMLKPRIAGEHMATVYETLERPLIPVLAEMESHGIKADAQELKRLSDDFDKRLGDLEIEIHKIAGEEFNIGSPKQLGEILFDKMGLEGGKKGKTGAYATGADVLEGLAAEGHELPARVLDWRQLAKLKSTYTDALIKQINAKTGRVHTSFSMAATSTGRLASSDPNLQNIPIRTEEGRKIRKAFVAEPGHKLISADYSQIELRLLAHVADIGALKDAFHADQDIHAMTASEVFGVPIEGMDPMVRRNAKAINFGIIYGISAFGLARQLDIPRGEASEYIKAYFAKFPGIRKYMDDTIEFAKDHGFVSTLFGRKCHVKGINDKGMQRGFAERAAINAPIQGGAADIIKRAMVRLPDALTDAGLSAKMLLQVHDELIFEVPDAEVDATQALVKEVMEGAATLDVPLVVDAGVGENWDEAH